ncbi:MAG: hypothetical protein B7Y56_15495 [Gallionellales bacterium 35-53-114]|jgi:hypothetical protein|nr:MAG: hypothetical protein B7Y56_15495 [Gallionellales bacterium 35-53-114]OYZ62179.1 MAG: hypothetical protein B7Y04_15105 [Gallionellales bacterium 24-53-125]OZB07238.1 MAG: hypothetical protein B7X61_15345 [Gallionellales bacterium 39-52-133]HQS59805.1 GIY-YIG nuclease family protein [Gallionellaceae bacterium]HQS76559.1 GIY-YIG nuclease family protein [Gallionellaceae bacterium]
MSNKKIRLSELGKIHPVAGLDHRHFMNDTGRLTLAEGLPRKDRRKLAAEGERLAKEYGRIIRLLSQSGARFPTDKILRQMAIEYNHRYASSGIYTQPISFNYFEPFLHIRLIKQVAPYVEVEQECNHLFYADDFFSYVTSSESDGFSMSTLLELPQDQIFHFSTCGNVTDFSYLNGEDREFSISGFSMIRRGTSLYWYLIGGELLDEDEWKLRSSEQPEIDLAHVPQRKKKFLTESIAEHGPTRGKPTALEGTDKHLRTIVAGEFDLEYVRHISRCYLAEYENSFDVVCDDPEVFSQIEENDTRAKILKTMTERFSRTAVLWSLAEGLFQLPSYFNARLVLNRSELGLHRHRIPSKKGGKGLVGEYSVIPALDTNGTSHTSTITMVKLPQYEIETEGHWRRLASHETGVDRHGNTITGRTWVASSSKWKPSVQTLPTIFLKDTLAAAKLKIAEYIEASERSEQKSNLEESKSALDSGELYVMRCAAMKDQIFKVGFTEVDSAQRASQLSSATGVPLAFVVLKKWEHKEARKLEMEVHMMLAPYRINDSREFFMVKYDVIVNAIESVLNRAG